MVKIIKRQFRLLVPKNERVCLQDFLQVMAQLERVSKAIDRLESKVHVGMLSAYQHGLYELMHALEREAMSLLLEHITDKKA